MKNSKILVFMVDFRMLMVMMIGSIATFPSTNSAFDERGVSADPESNFRRLIHRRFEACMYWSFTAARHQ